MKNFNIRKEQENSLLMFYQYQSTNIQAPEDSHKPNEGMDENSFGLDRYLH